MWGGWGGVESSRNNGNQLKYNDSGDDSFAESLLQERKEKKRKKKIMSLEKRKL